MIKDYPYQFERLKLRNWLKLNDLYGKILSAVDVDELVDYIDKYISTALGGFNIEETPWMETAYIMQEIQKANLPTLDFPSLKGKLPKKESKIVWDYDGRTWYIWLHAFSKEYGWSPEYIAEMDVDDAFGLMQEILIDDQLEREWDWQLSEIAYPYDKSTKKSKFKPLERPFWMKKVPMVENITKVKIDKRYIPVGNVVSYQDVKH